jgi:uncharacterized membrane protein YhaH (DUF805 family)
MPNTARLRRLIPWLMGFVALGGLFYSALGIGMVGSLAPDPPTRQWTIAAYVYLAAFVVCLVALIVAVIVLFRRPGHDASSDGSAAV